MRLKTLAVGLAIAIGVYEVVTALSFVRITDQLKDVTAGMELAIESIRSAEELQVALLAHARSRLLATVTTEPRHMDDVAQADREIDQWSAAVKARAVDPEDSVLVERVLAAIASYRATRARLEREGVEPLAIHLGATEALEQAYASLEALITRIVDQARATQAAVERQNRGAERLGLAAALLFVVLLAVVLGVGGRVVYAPLLGLAGTIQRFGKGDVTARAAPLRVVELDAIGKTFNDMAERLADQRERELRFLASVAHDLKNPLGAIRMSSELLGSGDALPAGERSEIAGVIRRQASYLERLVGDLLDTTRIESGALDLELEAVDLAALARETVSLHQGVSPAHKLRCDLPADKAVCHGDRARLAQVLNNLVSNAIKYSPYGGEVVIAVRREGAWIVLAVTDHGMGIPADERERIFEPFRRSARTRGTIPGVGLGLSVCRRILEAHGGRIAVESEPERGATFRIFVPARSS